MPREKCPDVLEDIRSALVRIGEQLGVLCQILDEVRDDIGWAISNRRLTIREKKRLVVYNPGMEDEPKDLSEDLDDILYRLILPDAAERYAELKREHKERVRDIMKRARKPERKAKIEKSKQEFAEKLKELLDEVLGRG